MEKMWSQFVQSSEELYESRALRFRNDNKDIWLNAMKILDGMSIIEIGCGGGILCHMIKTCLPDTTVTGVDRDEGHIEFAAAKSKDLNIDCKFVTGDALALPFEDESFDACTSHTVIEHVENSKFISEQYRILKTGGVISVLSVRTNLNVSPENWMPDNAEEVELLNKAWSVTGDFDKEHGIGSFGLEENELPAILEKAGFQHVSVNFISLVPYAPDSADVSHELALRQINTNRVHALSSMRKAINIAPDGLSEKEKSRLTELINQRFDDRVNMYLRGEKLWDIAASTVMVVTGYKNIKGPKGGICCER